jgi:hypothetical protein
MEAGESGRNMESVPDLVEEVLKHPSENATVQGMSELFHSLNNKYIKYNLYKGSHHKGTVKPVYAITSIKQSHVLKGHLFLAMS